MKKSEMLHFRASIPMIKAIMRWAMRLQVRRSEAVRDILRRGLESVGEWPPPPAENGAA